MRKVDVAAFLSTAIAVLVVNSILAVAIGCSFYVLRYLYIRLYRKRLAPAPPLASTYNETLTTTTSS